MRYLFLLFVGCTDAELSQLTAFGSGSHITCWSGGTKIYDGFSTGKIAWKEGGGAAWRDNRTGKLVETFADCIFEL